MLEGFDFGVGMLHRSVGRTEAERRAAVASVGPLWDGNEVWLIVGGAAIFAAFPAWYATWFSAAYLAVMLLLVALIIRGVSFEWRGKVDGDRWRGTWSWALTIGSALIPLVLGIALGDLLAGLPIDGDEQFTGSFWDLFTPYGVWMGVTLVVLSLLHGSTFLGLRTTGVLHERAHATARRLSWPAVVVVAVFAVWTVAISDGGVWRSAAAVVPALGALAAALLLRAGREGGSFAGTAVAIGGYGRRPLREPLPQRDGVVDRRDLQPHRLGRGVERVRPEGDDRRRRGGHPPRPALPGLVLLGVPGAGHDADPDPVEVEVGS